jgi:ParB family chromosome partitioning protein
VEKIPVPDNMREIDLKQIQPSRLNPRLEVNIERLNELAESIKEVGLLEPIIVRPVGDKFEVVVGERRYRASQQAGLKMIPAIVRDYADDEVVQLNLIENVQREELSAVEKGRVCKYLLSECSAKYPSQVAIAEKIGVSPETISNWLRTVEVIPEEAQGYIAPSTMSGEVPRGKIDYQTAVKVGRSVHDPEKQVEIIKELAERHRPVKERTLIIEKIANEPEKSVEEAIEEVATATIAMNFSAEDKEMLANGLKTQTSRTNAPDPKVKTGATVYASIYEPNIAQLRITSVERKKLRYFTEEDASREGSYTLAEFKNRWKQTHGDWDEDQLIYLIRFEKLK